jgi:hypothetical protein
VSAERTRRFIIDHRTDRLSLPALFRVRLGVHQRGDQNVVRGLRPVPQVRPHLERAQACLRASRPLALPDHGRHTAASKPLPLGAGGPRFPPTGGPGNSILRCIPSASRIAKHRGTRSDEFRACPQVGTGSCATDFTAHRSRVERRAEQMIAQPIDAIAAEQLRTVEGARDPLIRLMSAGANGSHEGCTRPGRASPTAPAMRPGSAGGRESR